MTPPDSPSNADPDPILLRIVQNLLDAVAEEMGSALERTGFSPNIKERRDFSCAIFDAEGAMIAQAAHIPVHLGAMPLSVEAALAVHDFEPGDVVLLNDPWSGGTHLPDLTTVSAVFEEGQSAPSFFLATRAHHADVGGAVRGSMALFTEITQEGLRIPPVLWRRRGEIVRETEALILANMRQPEERRGDLAAQENAHRVGEEGLRRLLLERGREELVEYSGHLQDAAERHVRALLAQLPNGEQRAVEWLDDDGIGDDSLPLHLKLTIDGEGAHFDFTGTAPACAGPLNANRAITLSAIFYVLRVLAGAEIPSNSGCLRPIDLTIPPGSLLDPPPPHAVAGGNVETSQRLVDLCFAVFAEWLPDRVPAQSQGTMNNLTLGGRTPHPFSYYETIGGGGGATAGTDGLSGHHSHMTNTRNTPIEALEHALPVRVEEYTLREGSGGAGEAIGGEGVVRALTARAPLEAALLTERRSTSPRGHDGGGPGERGKNERVRTDGARETLPGKWSGTLQVGETLRLETPGGGGVGAMKMDSRLVAHRGFHRDHPENTIEALRAARALGVSAIEFDVHATADGVWVMHHDPTLLRMHGVGVTIAETTWAELKKTAPVATLEEALEVFAPRDGEPPCRPMIEVKPTTDRDFAALGKLLAALPSIDPMVIVRGDLVPPANAALPDVPIYLFHEDWAAAWERRDEPLAGYDLRHDTVTDESVVEECARFIGAGKEVAVWTIDDPAVAQRWLDAGATWVISNRPDRIARTLS